MLSRFLLKSFPTGFWPQQHIFSLPPPSQLLPSVSNWAEIPVSYGLACFCEDSWCRPVWSFLEETKRFKQPSDSRWKPNTCCVVFPATPCRPFPIMNYELDRLVFLHRWKLEHGWNTGVHCHLRHHTLHIRWPAPSDTRSRRAHYYHVHLPLQLCQGEEGLGAGTVLGLGWMVI